MCEDMRLEYIKLARSRGTGTAVDSRHRSAICRKGAFYAYPNVSSFFGRGVNSPSDLAGKLLREAHVATVPGEGFGTHKHIRISYATSVGELDRGLERIRKLLGAL